MRSLTNVDIKYMRFCLCKWNWGTDFIFHKTNFGNSKKLESIVNILVFFIKISCQSKESPLCFSKILLIDFRIATNLKTGLSKKMFLKDFVNRFYNYNKNNLFKGTLTKNIKKLLIFLVYSHLEFIHTYIHTYIPTYIHT